jgi:hypothetical protein
MKKILWLTVGLSLLLVTCTSAEIFRCRTPDGELVMTDQRDELPADCQPVNEPTDAGSFNIVPSVPVNEDERPPVLPEQVSTPEGQEFTSWQRDSNALVESYKNAFHRRYHEDLEKNRLRAEQDISELKKQKHKMLNDLQGSGMTIGQQQSVRKNLDRIPEK